MLRSAEIITLEELCGDTNPLGKYVRVTGYLSDITSQANIAKCSNGSLWFPVDLELAQTVNLKEGCLCQLFGEIRFGAEKVGKTIF